MMRRRIMTFYMNYLKTKNNYKIIKGNLYKSMPLYIIIIMSGERLTGRVKWFNNKNGFGFISTLGDDSKDIFAHYTAIRGYTTERGEGFQYKYLVQGEYLEFVLTKMDEGNHEFKATDISGIQGGKLMCDTQSENPRPRTRPHPQRRGRDSLPERA